MLHLFSHLFSSNICLNCNISSPSLVQLIWSYFIPNDISWTTFESTWKLRRPTKSVLARSEHAHGLRVKSVLMIFRHGDFSTSINAGKLMNMNDNECANFWWKKCGYLFKKRIAWNITCMLVNFHHHYRIVSCKRHWGWIPWTLWTTPWQSPIFRKLPKRCKNLWMPRIYIILYLYLHLHNTYMYICI